MATEQQPGVVYVDHTPTHWAIMPFIDAVPMTLQAVEDLLAQTVPVRVLLVDQGSSEASRRAVDRYIELRGDFRVLCCHYLPALPSLSAVWNTALRMVWDLGEHWALVVNNDVRLAPVTYEALLGAMRGEARPLFVSAVGVREATWRGPGQILLDPQPPYEYDTTGSKGGPDFSCFLITIGGHKLYPFDESLIPAYTEDCDAHRRYMLGGHGDRIYSVNVPFLHLGGGSGTIKQYTPEQRSTWNRAYAGVVARYTQLWGGPPNQETYVVKGDPASARPDVTTPLLQARVQAGDPVLPVLRPELRPEPPPAPSAISLPTRAEVEAEGFTAVSLDEEIPF